MTMTTAALLAHHDEGVGDDDPAPKPKRRRFTAEYKLAILEEYERLSDPGGERARCCAVRACTRRIWSSGAGHATRVRSRTHAEAGEANAGAGRERSAAPAQHAPRRRVGEAQARVGDPGKSIGALGAAAGREQRGSDAAAVIDECFGAIEPMLGARATCKAVGRPRATHYRHQAPPRPRSVSARPAPPNKLTDEEVGEVLDVLRSERFVDLSPAQVFHILLDEGLYLAGVSFLSAAARPPVRSASNTAHGTPPRYDVPTRCSHAAGRVELGHHKAEGPQAGDYYDLYVVLDIFSRYVVASLVAPCESGELAKELIADTVGASSGAARPAAHSTRTTVRR